MKLQRTLTSKTVESDPYSLAETIALIALGPRAKSRGELFAHLKKRGIPEDIANAVLFRLQEQSLVNDEEFARAGSESRQRAKKLSKRVIASELQGSCLTCFSFRRFGRSGNTGKRAGSVFLFF